MNYPDDMNQFGAFGANNPFGPDDCAEQQQAQEDEQIIKEAIEDVVSLMERYSSQLNFQSVMDDRDYDIREYAEEFVNEHLYNRERKDYV